MTHKANSGIAKKSDEMDIQRMLDDGCPNVGPFSWEHNRSDDDDDDDDQPTDQNATHTTSENQA